MELEREEGQELSFNEVFSGKVTDEGAKPPVEAEPKPQERAPDGKFKAAAEVKPGEKAPDAGEHVDLSDDQVSKLTPQEQGWYRAMKSERAKRQETEKGVKGQLEALQREIELLRHIAQPQAVKPAAPPVEEAPKSFWDDPEKFIQHALSGVTGKLTETEKHQQYMMHTALETMAKARHQDYDAVYGVFASVAQTNPMVIEQVRRAPDPAEAAYQLGKRLMYQQEIEQAGGLEALREKIRAEELERIKAEAGTREVEAAMSNIKIPASPSGMRATSGLNTKHNVEPNFKEFFPRT